MAWWVKVTPNGQSYPVAMGPFPSQAVADAVQAGWAAGNPTPPTDPGTVVNGPDNYPETLKRPMNRVSLNGAYYVVYSDGVLEAEA